MSVFVYVGHSRNPKIPREPEHSHEVSAIIEICQLLRDHFEDSDRTYAVLVSPQHSGRAGKLYADVVILTELGLGILELKDYPGEIICKGHNQTWFSKSATGGKRKIKGGQYTNPHQQVQFYGTQIWDNLTDSPEGLPRRVAEGKLVQFHTAVCFSNINADVEGCKRDVHKYYQNENVLEPWEKKFEILTLPDVPHWVLQLRFEAEMSPHTPVELSEEDIHRIATNFFGCKIWVEMDERIQEPYGYLALTKDGRFRHIFRLTDKEHIIGRDAKSCSLLLPQRFESVSRKHALIEQVGDEVYLQDLGSSYGTFINDKQLEKGKRVCLTEFQRINLGDLQCELAFSKKPFLDESGEAGVTKPPPFEPVATESEEVVAQEEGKSKKRFWQKLFSSE